MKFYMISLDLFEINEISLEFTRHQGISLNSISGDFKVRECFLGSSAIFSFKKMYLIQFFRKGIKEGFYFLHEKKDIHFYYSLRLELSLF